MAQLTTRPNINQGAPGVRSQYAADDFGAYVRMATRSTSWRAAHRTIGRSKCPGLQASTRFWRKHKVAPPSGEGRGHQSGTLLSPVLEEKYRTLFVRALQLCGSTYRMIRPVPVA